MSSAVGEAVAGALSPLSTNMRSRFAELRNTYAAEQDIDDMHLSRAGRAASIAGAPPPQAVLVSPAAEAGPGAAEAFLDGDARPPLLECCP